MVRQKSLGGLDNVGKLGAKVEPAKGGRRNNKGGRKVAQSKDNEENIRVGL